MSIINDQTITQGITLTTSGNYISPLTITSTGAVEVASGNAIFAGPSTIGTVINQGIVSTGTMGTAILLKDGGYVDNIGGQIAGAYSGVYFGGAVGTVTNTGTIGGGGEGIRLGNGGAVDNKAGLITGYDGIYVGFAGVGTVTNAGTIIGTASSGSYAVQLIGGGTFTNSGLVSAASGFRGIGSTIINTGTIIGNSVLGISMGGPAGTIVNSGTISGGAAAIGFTGTGGNLLVLENGYHFHGSIRGLGTAGINLTVELAGTVGNAVTVNYNNLLLTNFKTVDVLFGPTGNATLDLSNMSGALPATISGFNATSDIIDLTAIGTDGHITGQSSTQVTVSGSLGTVTLNLDPSDATNLTTVSDQAFGVDLEIACFCRGTMILTDRGEVPVEDLAVGDRAVTLSGSAKPIRWIGVGRSLLGRTSKLSRPIIVRRGALADNVPCRDLYLTHGHGLLCDAVLIPVENLINHRSILWDETARAVEYYHVELEDHDVVFADGAPAETYYDADNRALFQNTRPGSEAGAAAPTVAPVLSGGDIVDKVWAALFERAGGRIAPATTEDPDLHLTITGERLDPVSVADGVYTFAFAAPPSGSLHLGSRTGVPSLLGVTPHDHRRLGVAISRIELRQAGVVTAIDCEAPLFAEGGCYPAERGYCWTDGELTLPPGLFAHLTGVFTLSVHTEQPGMRYSLADTVAAAA